MAITQEPQIAEISQMTHQAGMTTDFRQWSRYMKVINNLKNQTEIFVDVSLMIHFAYM